MSGLNRLKDAGFPARVILTFKNANPSRSLSGLTLTNLSKLPQFVLPEIDY